MRPPTTLQQYLLQELRHHPEHYELVMMMSDIATIGKLISAQTNRAGLSSLRGLTDNVNIQDEVQANLDVYTNELYKSYPSSTGLFASLASEEEADGSHSIERCYEVTAETLDVLFAALKNQDVLMEGVILKASMVLSGKDNADRAGVDEVAKQTLQCLKEHVPGNLAGVVFLSGGQGEEEATAHLSAMNALGKAPWPLTFSYSRAIQNPVLELWAQGKKDLALQAYLHRAKPMPLPPEASGPKPLKKIAAINVSHQIPCGTIAPLTT